MEKIKHIEPIIEVNDYIHIDEGNNRTQIIRVRKDK
jgi:hypothetical protein